MIHIWICFKEVFFEWIKFLYFPGVKVLPLLLSLIALNFCLMLNPKIVLFRYSFLFSLVTFHIISYKDYITFTSSLSVHHCHFQKWCESYVNVMWMWCESVVKVMWKGCKSDAKVIWNSLKIKSISILITFKSSNVLVISQMLSLLSLMMWKWSLSSQVMC